MCACAQEVGEGSLCNLKGKYKAHKAGSASRQQGKARQRGRWQESAELADALTDLLWILLRRADPVSPSELKRRLATVRRAIYPRALSCFSPLRSADKSRRKLPCVCADGEELS